MKYFFNLVLVLYSIVSGANEISERSCSEQCNGAFGLFVGQSFLTPAYSNCSDQCVSEENNYISIKGQKEPVFTGMKWQCVEYARRWLIENKGLTFSEVKYAYHVWDLNHFVTIDKNEKKALLHCKNKASKAAPAVGDLLIYSKELAITGHVAVVVGVDQNSILIAEQNYFNRLWESKDYARRLMFGKDKKGRYRVYDDSVMGWLKVVDA